MKKILISIIVLAFSASAMAIVIPNVVGISFESENGIKAQSNWYEAADGDDTKKQNGESTLINLPAGDGVSDTEIFIYHQASYGNMASLYTPQLAGKYITIRTNSTETNYKFVFTALYPETLEVKIVDSELDSIFIVNKNVPYAFTAPAGQTLTNRFQFYEPFSGDEGELDICYQYGDLTINNNPYTTNIVVKDEDGQVVLDKMARTTPQVISLSALTKGEKYQVIVGDKTMIIRVQ